MVLASFLAFASFATLPKPNRVEVVKEGSAYHLQVDGKRFFVRGVGGSQDLDDLAAVGGNSFRTWGADELDAQLTEAAKRNLFVCAGIWLGHKRHGFRYDDPAAVKSQLDKTLETVAKYKDRPNLLVWGLGNEVELDGDDVKAYTAINDIAKAVKKLDPNHPTMTVVAEIGGNKIERLKTLCPDIDILGINSYAGLASLPERLKQAGWTKPYIVTEFGPPGPWEVGKTEWGASFEPSSSAKADIYRTNYERGIANQPQCLGSYAFLWGHKQEATATWFGMMLPSGEKTGAVDAMAQLWGKPRTNRAPVIAELKSPVANRKIAPGTNITATATASDPDGDKLTYRWVIQADPSQRSTGGDQEAAGTIVANWTDPNASGNAAFRNLTKPGAYRIYVYVTDGKGNGAVANLPFLIEG